ncbi:Ig-like domain-containing protein [Comamonas fluminis]|uniref:Ig-like domain-containing protein n=1 Tax=Comamonas fluminis TaxID=2796366 RepID=UPI001C483885|nr:VCBS domain-containing protein [Comamonas fluminis]
MADLCNKAGGQGTVTGSGDVEDIRGADGATVTGVVAGDNGTTHVNAGVGSIIQGQYGTLVLQANGSYVYTRDVNAPQDAVEDVFTYTIKDADGDESTATLTITIADKAPVVTNPPVQVPVDPMDPDSPTRPVIKPGPPVSEGGLPDGSDPDKSTTTTTGTITLTPGDETTTVTVTPPGGDPVTLVPGVNPPIKTPQGEVTFTYTEGDPSTNTPPTITYEYELKTPVDDASKPPTDEFNVTITDQDGDSTTVTVLIDILDDQPVAKDDTATVGNMPNTDGKTTASGNVLGGQGTVTGSGDVEDIRGADGATVSGVVAGDNGKTHVNAGVGSIIQGQYGTLVLQANGSYVYTRDVNAPQDAVEDVFTYTIKDADGDESTATLTITIADKAPVVTNPPVQVPVNPMDPDSPTRPVIKPGPPVSEGGLPDGSDPDKSTSTTTGTITLTPGDETTTVTVTPPGGDPVTLVPGVNPPIKTPQGEVTFTYTEGDPSTNTPPTITYEYELKTPVDDASKPPTDEFNVTITDQDGDSTTVTVLIDILDDQPVAKDDTATVGNMPNTDGKTTASGNVLGGQGTVTGSGDVEDIRGADGATVTGVVAGDNGTTHVNAGVGSIIQGQYGTLVLQANGSYVYTRDVNAPQDAVEDVFTYTIKDADGDESTATLTITIADKAPVVTNPPEQVPVDPMDPDSPTRPVIKPGPPVSEGGLPDGSDPDKSTSTTTGTITLTPGDETTTVTVTPPGGDPVTLVPGVNPPIKTPQGEVTFTYTEGDPSTNTPPTITYEYELKTPVDDASKPPTDEFNVTITDQDGDSTTVTVLIDILDDQPVAKDDTATVGNMPNTDGKTTASGNVLGGQGTVTGSGDVEDIRGADGATVSGVVAGDNGKTHVNAGVGSIIQGQYGTLVLQANGSYVYTRDVNAPQDAVEDVFTYTIKDADGDESTATLTITIADKAPVVTNPPEQVPVDPMDPDSPTRPVIKPGPPVSEGGLPDGSDPDKSTSTTTGTITLTPGDETTTVTVTPPGGDPVTLVPGVNPPIKTPQGEVTFTYTEGDPSTNTPPTITYEYELKTPVDDASKPPTDEFNVTITDQDGDSTTVTVLIDILDDQPMAKDDTATVGNMPNTDGKTTASGNVLGGQGTVTGSGDVEDIRGADGATVTGVVAGDNGKTHVNAGVGSIIQGQYGTLVLQANGSYVYTRDVNAPQDAVEDVFTYTIKDADGDESTATLTITIADKAPVVTNPPVQVPVDPMDPDSPTRPVIKPGPPVSEGGLPDGSDPDKSTSTTTGTITLTPGDETTTVTVTPPGGDPVTLVPGVNPPIKTPQGEVTFTYTEGDPSTNTPPTITYEYELKTPVDDASKPPTDEFNVTITDQDGDSTTVTVLIDILDDQPMAKDDTATVGNMPNTDGKTTASGNVLGGQGTVTGSGDVEDIRGADGATVTGVVAGDNGKTHVNAGVGSIIQGQYGTLVLQANGSYVYTRDVNAPQDAVEDVFTYTIKDADGDESTATLTITIADKAPVVTNPPVQVPVNPMDPDSPTRPVIKPDRPVSEGGLPDGSDPDKSTSTTTGTITLTPGDETTTVTVTPPGGDPVTLVPGVNPPIKTPQGEVTFTYTEGDPSTNTPPTITYEYELKTPVDDASKPPTDEFNVTITDQDGDSTTVTVVVEITDDVPVAKPDSATVDNGSNTASSNALGNDTLGADRDTLVTSAKGPNDSAPVSVDPDTGKITVTGQYGTLTLDAKGDYTYTRFNDSPLNATEVFDYTITDIDGDSSPATITITIADNTPSVTDKDGNPPTELPVDPTDPNSPTRPVIKPDGSVSEGGLTDGSTPGKGNTTTGTIVLTPGDDTTTVTVTPPGGPSVTLVPDVPTKVITPQGEVTLTYTEGDPSTNTPPKVTYEYELKTPVDDSSKSPTDEFNVTITDKDGDSTTVTVLVDITDDAPAAADDSATVDNGSNTATGNALDNDTLGADRDTLVTSAKGPNDSAPVTVDPDTGKITVTGQYGTLTLSPDGSYVYTRTDGSPLNATEVFDYTITDKDGDSSPATITITIADNTPSVTDKDGNPPTELPVDPSDPNSPTRPVIKPDGSVSEGGLTDGSTPGKGNTTTGTIVLEPGDDTTTVTVTPPGGPSVTLVPDVPTKVITPQGEVTLTYTEGDPSTNTPPKVTYEYELKTPVDDSSKSPTDEFNVTITDKDGDSTTVTVLVDITDDAPAAADDSATVDNGSNTATGNALGNDTLGADRDTLVTSAKGPNDSAPVTVDPDTGKITVTGQYGTLTLSPDGSYVYTRTDGSPLNATEVFDYTITDKDGDPASATITITIADKAPTLTPPSTSGNTPGNPSVSESGLDGGSDPDSGSNKTTGSFEVESPDGGTTTITVTPPGGSPQEVKPGVPTVVDTPHGQVTVTYTPGDGTTPPTVTYEYELKTPADGSGATPPTDSFTITVTDGDGDSTSSTVTVDIVDDRPDAQDDGNTTLVNVPVTGQLGGNDQPGADGIESWTLGEPPKHGTVTIDPATGQYIFTPAPGFVGTDTFTYTVTDKDGSTDTATVTITVTNRPPVAVDDSNVTAPGEPAKGNVITGGSSGDHADSDPDGQPVTVTEITVDGITVSVPPNDSVTISIPNKGVLEIHSDGSYTFTAQPLWGGQVPDIHYTISDGAGGTSSAVLRITANAAPLNVDPPARPNTGITTDVGTTVAPPLSGGSSTLLVLGDAMTDTPSVFWESYRYFQDMRVPTVMHPITYVNLEVQRAQLEAVQTMLANWPVLNESRLHSIGLSLAQDPNLFVQHAVQAAQQERRFWEFLARNIQANLPTETPLQEMLRQHSEELNKAEAIPDAPAKDSAQEPVDGEKPQALLDLLERWNAAEAQPQATGMMDAMTSGKSASFSEQLKQSANDLPSHLG